MVKLFYAFICVFMLVSCGTSVDPVEKEICDCLDANFESNGITFTKGMSMIEDNLVAGGYTNSNSMQEHINFAKREKKLRMEQADPDPLSFLGESGAIDIYSFTSCFKQAYEKHKNELNGKPVKKLIEFILSLGETGGNSSESVISFYEKEFNEEIFQHPLFTYMFDFLVYGDRIYTRDHHPYLMEPVYLPSYDIQENLPY